MLQGLTRKMRHSLLLSRYNILPVYTKQFSHDAFTVKIQICNRYVLQEVKCKQQSAVWDNTPPTLSKTFQDFGFFSDVNQTVTVASTVFVK